MKKTISILLSMLIVLSLLYTISMPVFGDFEPTDISAAQDGSIEATYDVESKTLTIAVKEGMESSGVIRDYNSSATGNGITPLRPVLSQIEHLIIGEGITHIGNYLFYYSEAYSTVNKLTNIIDVSFPTSLESIGTYAFNYAKLTEVDLSKTKVNSIGTYAFYENDKLTTLRLPNEVDSLNIGVSAFSTNGTLRSNLKNIIFPTIANEIRIDNNAFNYNVGIEYIEFLANTTLTLGATTPFSTNTTWINLEKTAKVNTNNRYFAGWFESKGFTVQYEGEESDNSFVTYPESSVYSLGDNIKAYFNDYSGVLDIVGSGATPDYTASNKTPLSSILTKITKIKIGEGITRLGDLLFNIQNTAALTTAYGPTSATEINFPSTLQSIGDYTFRSTSKVTSIDLSKTKVTSIGKYNFLNSTVLAEVKLPNTLEQIGDHVFYSISILTDLDLSNTKLNSIEPYCFYNANKLTDLKLPDTLTTIGTYAFFDVRILEELDLSNTKVSYIDEYAFGYLANYSGINFKLKSVKFPENINSLTIKNYTFRYATAIEHVEMSADVLPNFGAYTFPARSDWKAVNKTAKIHANQGYLVDMFEALGFTVEKVGKVTKDYFESYPTSVITEIGTPTASNVKAYFNEYTGALDIIGKGAIKASADKNALTLPITQENCIYLTEINVHEGITSLGNYLFGTQFTSSTPYRYLAANVNKLSLPSTLETIGTYAFRFIGYSTDGLEIDLSNTKIKNISDYAFYTAWYNSIDFPACLETIGTYAFAWSRDYTTRTSSTYPVFDFSNTALKSVGGSAFANSYASGIKLPATVESIGASAFNYNLNVGKSNLAYFELLSDKYFKDASNPFSSASYNASGTAKIHANQGHFIETLESLGFKVTVIGEQTRSLTDSYPTEATKNIGKSNASDVVMYINNIKGIIRVKGSGAIKSNVYQYDSTTKEVIFDDGITEIGYSLFYGLTNAGVGTGSRLGLSNLEKLHLPSSLRVIGGRAFRDSFNPQTKATNILEIPESVEQIDEGAFYMAYPGKIINNAKESQTIGSDAFNVTSTNGIAYFYSTNSAMLQEYEKNLQPKGWNFVFLNEPELTGVLPNGIVWTYDPVTKTITFEGEGEIPDFIDGEQPWYAGMYVNGGARQWGFSDGIRGIGSGVFGGYGGNSGLGSNGRLTGAGWNVSGPASLKDTIQGLLPDAAFSENSTGGPDQPKDPEVPKTGIENYVEGKLVFFPDVQPKIIGREIVSPLRFITEDLGATVLWHEAEKKVIIRHEENGKKVEIVLTEGSDKMIVNGQDYKTLGAVLTIENGRSLLPGRSIVRFWQSVLLEYDYDEPTYYADYYYRTTEPDDSDPESGRVRDDKVSTFPEIEEWEEKWTDEGVTLLPETEREILTGSSTNPDAPPTDNTQIILDAEPTNFKVVVPIVIKATMQRDGTVSTEGGYTVANECALGPVLIQSIRVVTNPEWNLVSYTYDFKNAKVSAKQFGMAINGAAVEANGALTLNESLSSVIRNKESKPLSFDFRLGAQNKAIPTMNIAAVIFTVDWDKI